MITEKEERCMKNLKARFTALLFTALLVIPTFAFAATQTGGATQEILFTIGKSVYEVDGNKLEMDGTPFIQDGRTLVPVRYLALALGVPADQIAWNGDTQEIKLTKGSVTVALKIGSNEITRNGDKIVMDVAPIISKDRTYLPARYVAEAFSYEVGWIAAEQAVIVKPKVVTVKISGFEFNPKILTIRTGETVNWINDDQAQHDVKSDLFTSPMLKKGDVFQFTFTEKGTYDYTCGIHPSMKGQIIVK